MEIFKMDLIRKEDVVTLSRGMQGKYGWEIKFYKRDDEDPDTYLERLAHVDKALCEKYNLNVEDIKNG
jgi:hypothetical protein